MNQPAVTLDNFWDEVKLFCHGQPKKADGLGFIVKDEESPAAKLWIAYCRNKGWDARAKFFVHMLRQGNALTMPCADPRTFDPEYNPAAGDLMISDKPAAASSPNFNPRSIAEQIAQAAKKLRPPSERRRRDYEAEEELAKPPTLEEIAAMPTPDLSPSLRKALGLKPAETQEDRQGEAA